jgi:hypothetical protein
MKEEKKVLLIRVTWCSIAEWRLEDQESNGFGVRENLATLALAPGSLATQVP